MQKKKYRTKKVSDKHKESTLIIRLEEHANEGIGSIVQEAKVTYEIKVLRFYINNRKKLVLDDQERCHRTSNKVVQKKIKIIFALIFKKYNQITIIHFVESFIICFTAKLNIILI